MQYDRKDVRHLRKAKSSHPEWPVVLSEGDSWFSHSDVIGRLDEVERAGTSPDKGQRPWALLRLEYSGDEILTIMSGGQRSRLRKLFRDHEFDAILFSGGGNDIIGADLLPLLRQYDVEGMRPEQLIDDSRFRRRIRQVQDCYRELLDLLADAKQKAKVFVHSYDYVVPSKRPVKLFGAIGLAGPWLIDHLNERHIPAHLHGGIVKILIDGYVAAIDALAAEPQGVGRLFRVETRGLVKGDWQDEIHPNRKGATRVAAAFEEALRREGVLK